MDYRCAYCRQIHPTLEALLEAYPDLQIIYRHYPLNLNRSAAAARIALCADALGWFELMHTRLFSAQQLDIESLLYDRTESERAAFNSYLYGRDTPVDSLLLQDIALARRVGVTGTPTFFLNGRRVPVGVPASQLRNYVHQALQSENRPARR
ncbi:DsbA family protein [Rhodothermus profundi]|uniref:DsbA family protein n=1 Tax=Rhodothermus profundi TaxID=633813 RepID=UPI001FE89AB9|nr:thioredoxin domain-containing protein [Rhodothermus profundi]